MAHIPTTVRVASHESGLALVRPVAGGLSVFAKTAEARRRPSYASLCVWPVSL